MPTHSERIAIRDRFYSAWAIRGNRPMNEKLIEMCAAAAHEMNRIYCASMGDMSQEHWEKAPEWQKASARNGVTGVFAGNTPEQSHESWMRQKVAGGWKFGSVKDPDKKEHPCMVPYAELPPEQKAKDELFGNVVRSMAKAMGSY